MSLPLAPVNNQISLINGISYIYNSTNRSWTRNTNLVSNVQIGSLTVTTSMYSGNVFAPVIGNATSAITASSMVSNTASITSTANPNGLGTGALIVSQGGASVYQDLWVGGTIYANALNTVTTSILSIQDPLLYLNSGNVYPYNYELGFYGHFVGGAANVYAHTGLVRNHIDNTWTLFSNVPEPSGNTINLASASTVLDALKVGAANVANTTVSVSSTTGALIVGGGAGVAGNLNVAGTVSGASVIATNGLLLNSNTINTSYNIPSGYNAIAVGPITMAAGATMTLAAGSRYVVI